MLMPLFTGLFGVPLLLTSVFRDSQIPRQEDSGVRMTRREVATSAFGGSVAGAVVGWIPGVSPAVATTVVQSVLPRAESEEKSMRSFIIAVSGVNTSNAVFALLALYFIERSRSGVTVALARLETPSLHRTALYLAALAGVAVLAFLTTLLAARHSFTVLRRLDYRLLSLSVIALLVLLTLAFAGTPGLPVLLAGTVIGLVPNVTHVRRVHCMGSLMLPLILFYL